MAKYENIAQRNTANALRTVNRRLENALKTLGKNSVTYNNLLSEITSNFGAENIRVNKKGIPQVKTGKEALSKIGLLNARAVKESTQNINKEISEKVQTLKSKLNRMGKRGTTNQVKQLETIESTISEVFDLYKTAQEAGVPADDLQHFMDFADDFNNRKADDFDDLRRLSKTAEKIIKYEYKRREEQQAYINEFEETDVTEDILKKYR